MKKLFLLFALAVASGSAARAEELKEATLPAATKAPQVGKVGQMMAVQLDADESQDFNLDLPKGQFFVYADTQRVGEGSLTSNMDATIYLLKRNGAAMPNYGGHLIYFNSRDRTARVGKAFSLAKPTGVRFRFKNESDGINNLWFTVVPAQPVKFLPFGFGSKLKVAKIGSNNGSGGTLEHREYEYLRATIPAGKWSISLGAKAEGDATRCYVSMNSLSARGVDYSGSIAIYGVGHEERQEKIVTFKSPTTLIFRVLNEGAADTNTISYDITIEPSTD